MLTRSALLDFLRRHREDTEDLHHDLHDNVHHARGRWHLGVYLETSDKILGAFKHVDKSFVTRAIVLCHL